MLTSRNGDGADLRCVVEWRERRASGVESYDDRANRQNKAKKKRWRLTSGARIINNCRCEHCQHNFLHPLHRLTYTHTHTLFICSRNCTLFRCSCCSCSCTCIPCTCSMCWKRLVGKVNPQLSNG